MISDGDFEIIDTPGIREIEIALDDITKLDDFFPEFEVFARKCNFSPCLHVHEPDCYVRRAAEEGEIHPDRYESYLRVITALQKRFLESEKNTRRLLRNPGGR